MVASEKDAVDDGKIKRKGLLVVDRWLIVGRLREGD
jgi:hypothetical protein